MMRSDGFRRAELPPCPAHLGGHRSRTVCVTVDPPSLPTASVLHHIAKPEMFKAGGKSCRKHHQGRLKSVQTALTRQPNGMASVFTANSFICRNTKQIPNINPFPTRPATRIHKPKRHRNGSAHIQSPLLQTASPSQESEIPTRHNPNACRFNRIRRPATAERAVSSCPIRADSRCRSSKVRRA